QQVANDFVVAEDATMSGPGPWALTWLRDDCVGATECKEAAKVSRPRQGRFATGSRVEESEFVAQGETSLRQSGLGQDDQVLERRYLVRMLHRMVPGRNRDGW